MNNTLILLLSNKFVFIFNSFELVVQKRTFVNLHPGLHDWQYSNSNLLVEHLNKNMAKRHK